MLAILSPEIVVVNLDQLWEAVKRQKAGQKKQKMDNRVCHRPGTERATDNFVPPSAFGLTDLKPPTEVICNQSNLM